ncbi:peptidoglycan DD-metalloendopeptidase family protein [Odoribacter lunatus]|uniref:peptidoglycan DD-metalloendopeptidase family protein n=1 Tax=Odoribacter lunatus TaxID=2941335 RepID=UPI00203FD747|nr:peptidoglycan DD-metalloendopeptidase family protein [Odoribacter lunatus]
MTRKKQIIFSSVLGVVLLVIIFWPYRKEELESLDEVEVVDSAGVEEIVYRYGIPTNNYDVNFGVVKRNQSLSAILAGHGLTGRQIYDLTANAKGVFDVRKIRSGQPYALFSTKDTLSVPEYFVYEIDPRSYMVCELTGEGKISLGKNPVEWKQKTAKGTVQSSLWNAMVDCQTDPLLAVDLSRIFGWTIDFFGLQKEDEFRVIYEQECIDGKDLSNFNILGALFRHAGQDYYAIPFMQDGEVLFYNEKGNSLEGAFLKAPLDYFRITSRFSNSRFHPKLKIYRPHHGVDYAAPVGTPVYAIGAGTVVAKGFQPNGGGNYLKIKHNGTYTTSYMHLSRFEKGINVGTKVAQKQIIGYVGSTGLSTGPHLDFRVFENGKAVNPLTIKSQPKKPVSDTNRPRFTVLRDSVMNRLEQL